MKYLFSFALAILAPSIALAQTVDVGTVPGIGGTVDIGTVQVIGTTTGTTVNTGDSTVNVNAGSVQVNDTTVTNTGTTTQIKTSTGAIPGTVTIKREDGSTVRVNTSSGLNVQVTQGALDVASQEAIVSLSNGSDVLITTDNDLTTYQALVREYRPGVRDITVADGQVTVAYRQPAKFFGIFGSGLSARATLNASGEVSVKLPWYSFLFKKDTSVVTDGVRVGISDQGVEVSQLVDARSEVRVRSSAKAINVMTSVVSGQSSVTIEAE